MPARLLLADQQNALRRLSPRRARWPEVGQLDRRVDEITARREELAERLLELTDEIGRAEVADREKLAAWTMDTSKRRPLPTAPALEQEREDVLAETDALALRMTEALDQKERFVVRHRDRLIKEADKETAKARHRCERLIDQLREAREELVELRSAAIWARLFPAEEVTHSLQATALMAGLLEPSTQLLGIKTQLAADAVFRALEADAQILTTLIAPGQVEALGRADPRKAVWEHSDEALAEKSREKERLIQEHRRQWGRLPPEWV